MKTNRVALWVVVSVLVCSGVFCASSKGFGDKHYRARPSAMHYSNYENNGFGIDPYAGYSPNVQMINPRSGPTPFQYRKWHARAFEETTGVPAPVGGYRLGRTVPSVSRIYRNEIGVGFGSHLVFVGEEVAVEGYGIGGGAVVGSVVGGGAVIEAGTVFGTAPVLGDGYSEAVPEPPIYRPDGFAPIPTKAIQEEEDYDYGSFDYAPAPMDGSYNQQFVGDGCFDVCYDPCFDPCAMPCFDPCPPMVAPVAEKSCFLSGIKNFFSKFCGQRKGFCASSKFTTDPWFGSSAYYSPAPMMTSWSGGDFGDYNYYDGGYAGGSYGSYSGGTSSSSCCGGGGSSFTGGTGGGGESYSNSYDAGFSDNGLGVDMNTTAPATKPAPGPAPAAAVDVPRATGTTYPAIPDTRPNPAPALPAANPATAPAAPGGFGLPANAPTTVPAVPSPLPGNTGVIRMMVPEDSVVYINGYQTKLSGVERNFTANNLIDGEVYDFEIRVVAMSNGQFSEQVKTTTLIGGKTAALAFMQYDTTYRAIASR